MTGERPDAELVHNLSLVYIKRDLPVNCALLKAQKCFRSQLTREQLLLPTGYRLALQSSIIQYIDQKTGSRKTDAQFCLVQ